jgi:hypothetical protein
MLLISIAEARSYQYARLKRWRRRHVPVRFRRCGCSCRIAISSIRVDASAQQEAGSKNLPAGPPRTGSGHAAAVGQDEKL